MFGLINIIIMFPYKTSTLEEIQSFENILKAVLIIQTSSTSFHVNLI